MYLLLFLKINGAFLAFIMQFNDAIHLIIKKKNTFALSHRDLLGHSAEHLVLDRGWDGVLGAFLC